MAAFPAFNTDHFESIARELGELVTGTQLDQLFSSRGIADVSGQSTKWRRIHISLLARQQADRCGNHVAAFIMAVMAPGRHVSDQGSYEAARSSLNRVFAFDGLYLGEDGQFRRVDAATTITDAKRRADNVAILRCHPDRRVDIVVPEAGSEYFKNRMEKVFNIPASQFNTVKVNGHTALQARKVRLIAAKASEIDVSALFSLPVK